MTTVVQAATQFPRDRDRIVKSKLQVNGCIMGYMPIQQTSTQATFHTHWRRGFMRKEKFCQG